jgi:hypothetical protein
MQAKVKTFKKADKQGNESIARLQCPVLWREYTVPQAYISLDYLDVWLQSYHN